MGYLLGKTRYATTTLHATRPLAAGHGAHDQVWLGASSDRIGQRDVGVFMGQVLLAGEEPDERPARAAVVVADGAAEHRIALLQRVQDGALGDLARHVQLHFAVDMRERAQVSGEDHPDHGSVWTSTDSTAGRSRTIGAQLSPASAEA